MHIEGKLSYRDDVRKQWAENPRLTVRDVMKRTGAPYTVVLKQRRELVAAGVLKGLGDRCP